MGFDEEVDAARSKLEAALAEEEKDARSDDPDTLRALLRKLQGKIQSRRLAFQLVEDHDGVSIEILHVDTDEPLGYVFSEGGEFVFESSMEEFFADFVDEDGDSFALRLYETLRADLPKYEVENR